MVRRAKLKNTPEQITNTEGVITLRNKPLGNYMEAVGIPEITDELLSSVQRDGTLSEQGINSIRGGPGEPTPGPGTWAGGSITSSSTRRLRTRCSPPTSSSSAVAWPVAGRRMNPGTGGAT